MSQRLQYLLQLAESTPVDSFVLFAIAKEYEKSGESTLALEYYEKLRSTDPGYVGLYYHLGKLFEQNQDHQNAVLTYKQGIETARKVRSSAGAVSIVRKKSAPAVLLRTTGA